MDPVLILFGVGIGLLVGATGMGGGSLMTPLLILVLGVKPVVAVGTDLAYAAVTKTVGGWRHLRQGTVDVSLSWWLAAGSCPSAIVGVYVLELLHETVGDGFDDFMIITIGATLLLIGALVLLRALGQVVGERDELVLERRHKVAAIALGGGVGFLLGITSAGSGTIIAMGLILGFRLTPRRVVGTDVYHAALLLWVAALAHVVSGNVDYAMAGTILLGSIPGVWVGASVATRVPESVLRPALGIVLVTSGMGLMTKVGADIPAPVLVAVPLVLSGISYLVLRRGAPAEAPAH
jgi:uncharacterized membrane protein YfcA